MKYLFSIATFICTWIEVFSEGPKEILPSAIAATFASLVLASICYVIVEAILKEENHKELEYSDLFKNRRN